jgi:hypothetical protein
MALLVFNRKGGITFIEQLCWQLLSSCICRQNVCKVTGLMTRKTTSINLIAIDRSTLCFLWGHDFRPTISKLHLKPFKKIPFLALTASLQAR